MQNKLTFYIVLIITFSVTFLVGRSFRVSQVPHGSKFSCNTCHTSGGGTPRNAFGLAVQSITGSNNTSFWGPDFAALDSDGDGFTNGEELQDPNGEWIVGNDLPGDASLVTHPGDPNDFPSPTSVDEFASIPAKFELRNNYPNPFNPTTNISFSIAENSFVSLEIYNLLGERVRSLVNESFAKGNYSTIWNARDDFGNKVNSGVYIYRLVADDFVHSKRMVLMK